MPSEKKIINKPYLFLQYCSSAGHIYMTSNARFAKEIHVVGLGKCTISTPIMGALYKKRSSKSCFFVTTIIYRRARLLCCTFPGLTDQLACIIQKRTISKKHPSLLDNIHMTSFNTHMLTYFSSRWYRESTCM